MPDGVENNQMSGAVAGVTINNDVIGVWNFHDYTGPKPAPPVARGGSAEPTNSMWKFRGVDSYLRIGSPYLQLNSLRSGQKAFVVQFKIITRQRNSFLFLVGETLTQFFALELRDAKFVVTCNFNFTGGIIQRTVSNYKDITESSNPVVIKAGVLPKLKLLVLSLNTR